MTIKRSPSKGTEVLVGDPLWLGSILRTDLFSTRSHPAPEKRPEAKCEEKVQNDNHIAKGKRLGERERVCVCVVEKIA